MLHSPVVPHVAAGIADVADLLADPDLVQTIEDHAETALEIRVRSKAAASLKKGSRLREAEEARIADLMGTVRLRAERLGMTEGALLVILNAQIDDRARRGRPAPTRETSRTLLTALQGAIAREADAIRALTAARVEMNAARVAREDAEQACARYGVKGAAL